LLKKTPVAIASGPWLIKYYIRGRLRIPRRTCYGHGRGVTSTGYVNFHVNFYGRAAAEGVFDVNFYGRAAAEGVFDANFYETSTTF
jgi:hypothetical protein